MANDMFNLALETGSDYYDLGTGQFYKFSEYAFMKQTKMPCSGVYLTDHNNHITALWREQDVQNYIKDENIHPMYM